MWDLSGVCASRLPSQPPRCHSLPHPHPPYPCSTWAATVPTHALPSPSHHHPHFPPPPQHLGSYRPRSSRRAVVPRRSIGDAAPSRPAPEALPPAPEPVPEPAVPEAAVSGPGRGSVGGRKGREEGEGARGREGRGGKEKGEGGRRGLVAEVAGAPLQVRAGGG